MSLENREGQVLCDSRGYCFQSVYFIHLPHSPRRCQSHLSEPPNRSLSLGVEPQLEAEAPAHPSSPIRVSWSSMPTLPPTTSRPYQLRSAGQALLSFSHFGQSPPIHFPQEVLLNSPVFSLASTLNAIHRMSVTHQKGRLDREKGCAAEEPWWKR